MTPAVSNLIRTQVTCLNARALEKMCHAELCQAHAMGDELDINALRGKIAVCREVQEDDWDATTITLAQLIEVFGVEP